VLTDLVGYGLGGIGAVAVPHQESPRLDRGANRLVAEVTSTYRGRHRGDDARRIAMGGLL
jgi:hypothetical protein